MTLIKYRLSAHTLPMKRAEYFFAYFKRNIPGLLSGLLAGLCCGLFGSGGGAVAVMTLERLCGFPSKKAHAAAISIMLPLTLAGAAVYCAGGGVDWHTLLFAAPGAMLGGVVGARLTGRIKPAALDRLFAAAMLCAWAWMLL